MALLLKYWPIILSITSVLVTVISFYFFVRWKFKMYGKDLTELVGKVERDRVDLLAKIKENKECAKEETREIKSTLKEHSRKLSEVEKTIERIDTKLTSIPQGLDQINTTIRESFRKIDEMKREFVSVQQYNTTVEDLRRLQDRVFENKGAANAQK